MSRGPARTSAAKLRSSPGRLKRAAYLIVHPVAGCHVAVNILRAMFDRSKHSLSRRLAGPKAVLNNCRRSIRLLREPDRFTFTYAACSAPVINTILGRVVADRTLIWYWREERRHINFGDYITEVLVKEFGYKTVNYHCASLLNTLSSHDFCLLIIGSELHKRMIDQLNVRQLYVWGQGKGHGEFFDIRSEPYSTKVKVFAVRGPHTIKQLKLDERTPVGDPALLMPLFFAVKRNPAQYEVTYIPHWSNRANWEVKKAKVGAERFVDIRCTRGEFWSKLNGIISSRFVLTNSLHTALTCHAYGTPWALCLADGDELNFPDKWRDFFEFLGVEDKATAVKNYEEGLEWWNDVGSKAGMPDLLPLLDSFPLPIKSKKMLAIISEMKSNRPAVKD